MSSGDPRHPNDRAWRNDVPATAEFKETTAHMFLKREIQGPAAVCDRSLRVDIISHLCPLSPYFVKEYLEPVL